MADRPGFVASRGIAALCLIPALWHGGAAAAGVDPADARPAQNARLAVDARPPVTCLAPGTVEVTPGQVAIEYIGHASFRFHLASGCMILLDPYASRVWIGYDFPPGLAADAVVITHPHYDHDAGRFRGQPFPWPDADVYDAPGSYELAGARLTGVRGKHADPYGKEFGQRNTVWVLEAEGIRFVHLGDNGPLTPEVIEALGRVDVLFIPLDANEHILSFETVEEIRRALDPRVLVPIHYRLSALEAAGKPDDLGNIDPWLEGRQGVRRLGTNLLRISSDDLPGAPEIWVFDPSPLIPQPDEMLEARGDEQHRPACRRGV